MVWEVQVCHDQVVEFVFGGFQFAHQFELAAGALQVVFGVVDL